MFEFNLRYTIMNDVFLCIGTLLRISWLNATFVAFSIWLSGFKKSPKRAIVILLEPNLPVNIGTPYSFWARTRYWYYFRCNSTNILIVVSSQLIDKIGRDSILYPLGKSNYILLISKSQLRSIPIVWFSVFWHETFANDFIISRTLCVNIFLDLRAN